MGFLLGFVVFKLLSVVMAEEGCVPLIAVFGHTHHHACWRHLHTDQLCVLH